MKNAFALRDLILKRPRLWFGTYALAAALVFCVLGLLMVSGWFLTMAAGTGLVALGSHTFNYLMPSAAIRGLAIGRTVSRYFELLISHDALFLRLGQLRVEFFERFGALPIQHRHLMHQEATERLTQDIDVLSEFVLRFVAPVFGAVCGVVLVGVFVWHWGVFLCLVLGLCGAMCAHFAIKSTQDMRELEACRSEFTHALLPALTHLLLWDTVGAPKSQFEALDDAVHKTNVRAQKLRLLGSMLVYFSLCMAALWCLWLAYEAQGTSLGYAEVALWLGRLLAVFGLLEFLLALAHEPLALARARSACARVNALFGVSTRPAHKQPLPQGLHLSVCEVVPHIPAVFTPARANFSVTAGEVLVIVGHSGAGKSSLLAAIAGELGFDGHILVNGEAIANYDACGIGFLGQDVDIFSQTLEDNLRLGCVDAQDEVLWEVLELVGLSDWVKSEPLGLKTHLGEQGAFISGGQARRVALARLLLGKWQLLLLDEPFAGLDEAARVHLWEALQKVSMHCPILLVSHYIPKGARTFSMTTPKIADQVPSSSI